MAAAENDPQDGGLRLFLGLLLTRENRLAEAIDQFRSAIELQPHDMIARVELARLLIGFDEINDAQAVLGPVPRGPARDRVDALVHRRRGDHGRAAAIYRHAVAADPRDFESWGHLGICLLAMGRPVEAGEALTRSLTLRRDQQQFREKWADAQVAAGQGEEGLAIARAFAGDNPRDVLVWPVIARLELLLGRPDKAREALAEGLKRDGAHVPSLIALADLDERENRLEALAATTAKLDQAGVDSPEAQLLRARLAYRRGRYDEALAVASNSPAGADPGGRAHLIGLIRDRIDDPDGAFAAFLAMNEETALEVPKPDQQASHFRDRIAQRMRLGTRHWVRSWRRAPFREDRPAPTFMLGFPRSGTTLLDTLLMGHPRLVIAEEKPMLAEVAEAIGGYDRLAELEPNEIETLRALYFARVDSHVGPRKDQQVIDKLPLGIVDIRLMHRLFPEARFIFVQRHPCDVVLSGFMTRCEPVGGMANFLTLEDTARLYDRVMAFWLHCRAVLPLLVHVVRYERLIDDIEAEMRPLASFLGLPWTPRLLDHRPSARTRGHVATPSYAQIQEPINDRAINRWHKYRGQMEPVLPTLRPWAEMMGYAI